MAQAMESLKKDLFIGTEEVGSFTYLGQRLRELPDERRKGDFMYALDQEAYAKTIAHRPVTKAIMADPMRLPSRTQYEDYRSDLVQLAWHAACCGLWSAYDASTLARPVGCLQHRHLALLAKAIRV